MRAWDYIFTTLICLLVSAVSFAQAQDSSSISNKPIKYKVAAVRTNLLAPLSNIGAGVCIGNRWSIEGDYYFPWMFREKDNRDATQLLAWGITG